MNTSIQDAFNLSWKLALVLKGAASPSLLDTYSEERLPVVAEMLNLTTKILKVTTDVPGSDAGWKRTGNIKQLGVNYRGSSIVIDQNIDSLGPDATKAHSSYDTDTEAGGLVQAGDRAPDAPGLVQVKSDNQKSSESTRLFKIFDLSRHTVLIFAEVANISGALAAVAKYPKELVRPVVLLRAGATNKVPNVDCDVLEDRDGHAYHAYRNAEGANAIAVIRPDGVIGAVVKDTAWLERYLNTIFIN